jgi:hypothetical protein
MEPQRVFTDTTSLIPEQLALRYAHTMIRGPFSPDPGIINQTAGSYLFFVRDPDEHAHPVVNSAPKRRRSLVVDVKNCPLQ